MRRVSLLIMALAMLVSCHGADAAFLVPDGATAPFQDWSRGDANSTYAEWDTFTVANGEPGNEPDVGSSGPGTANLEQNGAFAILASSGNIYSFQGPTSFDVTLPGYGLGAGYTTRVVVQAQTLGNVPDLSTVLLTYDAGAGSVTTSPEYLVQEEIDSGGFTGLVSTFGWDIVGFNPSDLLFEVTAAGSSMSLAGLAVDTYAQTGDFGAYPATVPEPTALMIAVLAGVSLLGRTRR